MLGFSSQEIIKLGLARAEQHYKISHSEEPDNNAEIDVDEMLESNKFWQTITPFENLVKKKIIFADWTQLAATSIIDSANTVKREFVQKLIDSGLEFYVYRKGKLVKINTAGELVYSLDEIEPIHNDKLLQLAPEAGLEADQLEILDPFKMQQLIARASELKLLKKLQSRPTS